MVKYRQVFQFGSLYLAYFFTIFVRRSFTFVLADVVRSTGVKRSYVGMVTSSQSIAYAISKFFSGFFVDNHKPKILLQASLIGSGLTAFALTGFSSVPAFSIFWFLNGMCQGLSWPSCIKILRMWFPPENFGTLWSLLSTSINVSSSVGPFIITTVALSYGWRIGMLIPALSAILMGILFTFLLSDDPRRLGQVSFHKQHLERQRTALPKRLSGSYWSRLLMVYQDPFYRLLGTSYLFINFIRTCISDWTHLYLMHDKHLSALHSTLIVSSIEIGGITGSIVSGIWSDQACKDPASTANHRSRLKVAQRYCMGFFLCLLLFTHFINNHAYTMTNVFIGFGMGFFINGPLTITGVVAMETVPHYMSGVASSVCSMFGNVGGVMAGLPFTYLSGYVGWHMTFDLLCVAALLSFCLLFILGFMECHIKDSPSTSNSL